MKLIQVRGVPDELHRALKTRAAREGTTMSALILRELPRIASQPRAEDVLARIRSLPPVEGESGAALVRAGREEREHEHDARRRRERDR